MLMGKYFSTISTIDVQNTDTEQYTMQQNTNNNHTLGKQRPGQHKQETLTLALKQGSMYFCEAIGYMPTCSKATRLSFLKSISKVIIEKQAK